MPLLTFVLLPFGAAFHAGMVPTHARTRAPLIAGIASVVSFVGMALLFPGVENGGVISQRIPWMSSAGIDLVFRLDGFSWLFGMMVFGIGALVVLYAHYYLSSPDPASRFFAVLDRKSTRLNSSHVKISYSVFCVEKEICS